MVFRFPKYLALAITGAIAFLTAAAAQGDPGAAAPDFEAYYKTLSREMLDVSVSRGRSDRPLVVMIHGWGADKLTYTDPLAMWLADRDEAGGRVDIIGVHYLCSPMKEPDLEHPLVETPLYKVFIGKPYTYDEVKSLWRALKDEGYNLVTWSQYYSNRTLNYAKAELDYIVREVIPAEFPSAGDIVFLAHSRGGLVARAYLEEHPAFAADRVRAVMMLSPANHGSHAAILAEQLTGLLEKKPSSLFCKSLSLKIGLLGAALKESDLAEIVTAVTGFVRNALRFLQSEAVAELSPDSAIVAAIDAGDVPGTGPDVPYYLFQGVSPHFNELFVQHNLVPGQYVRLGCALQDVLLAGKLDEMTSGRGDGLVAKASATVGDEVFAKEYEANHMSILVNPLVQADLLRELANLKVPERIKARSLNRLRRE